MAESIDDFFEGYDRSKIAKPASILYDYLKGKSNALSAAHDLLQELMKDPKSAKFIMSDMFANLLFLAVEQLLETHQPFVDLLCALQDLIKAEGLDVEGSPLPVEEISLRYELDERRLRYGDPAPDPDVGWMRDYRRDEWANLNHFAALAHAASFQDLSYFGRSTLDMTLSKGQWRVLWYDGPCENESNDTEALLGHVPAAAHWINICGQLLYDEPKSRAEWQEWETNLAWILEQKLPGKIKPMCQEMLAEMRRIEREATD